MKKLLLILTLPCLLNAGDKKTESQQEISAVRDYALGAVTGAWIGTTLGATVQGTFAIATDIWAGNYAGACQEAAEMATTITKAYASRNVLVALIEPEQPKVTPQQAILDKAHENAVKRQAIAEERAGARLRICLSEHAHCPDVNGLGIPKRCNSPARDFAMINDREADRVIANYVKFTQQRKGSI